MYVGARYTQYTLFIEANMRFLLCIMCNARSKMKRGVNLRNQSTLNGLSVQCCICRNVMRLEYQYTTENVSFMSSITNSMFLESTVLTSISIAVEKFKFLSVVLNLSGLKTIPSNRCVYACMRNRFS